MKNKFESNVASKTPKEKQARLPGGATSGGQEEPSLPWQVDAKDIEKASGPEGDKRKAAVSAASPFRTRAEFLVIILSAIFVVTIFFVSFMKKETFRSRNEIAMKEETVSTLESQVNKLNDENSAINSNLTNLEKRVNELTAQKELFADVLDGLTKNPDEPAPRTETAQTETE